ncbi:hypothetical protein KO527_13930 [Pseudoalteromonas sp. C2R02]|uniref:hypothetical protein n=1 Tax=Pseudoalteromonas sp. C2R02 TaxID=2841565 RepID=UPI001C09425A|nr:hypothetical protein [Pseudoalteromonas sp. C2R02]MBU2970448.1 hypothetical protein [Pseudoalteromonas sp. C2R02]
MDNKTLTKALLVFITVFNLSSCSEDKETIQINTIQINGLLLKGTLSNTQVIISDSDRKIVWQGKSNSIGEFIAHVDLGSDSYYLIETNLTLGSEIICDAQLCRNASGDVIADFGTKVPSENLGEFNISTIATSSKIINNLQLNSLTTLTSNLIRSQIVADIPSTLFNEIALSASNLILLSFGLNSDQDINLLNVNLSNLNQDTEQLNDDFRLLSIINAAMASDISQLNQISSKINDLYLSPSNTNHIEELNRLKSNLIGYSLNLSLSGHLNAIPDTEIDILSKAKTSEIELSKYKESQETLVNLITKAKAVPGGGS